MKFRPNYQLYWLLALMAVSFFVMWRNIQQDRKKVQEIFKKTKNMTPTEITEYLERIEN